VHSPFAHAPRFARLVAGLLGAASAALPARAQVPPPTSLEAQVAGCYRLPFVRDGQQLLVRLALEPGEPGRLGRVLRPAQVLTQTSGFWTIRIWTVGPSDTVHIALVHSATRRPPVETYDFLARLSGASLVGFTQTWRQQSNSLERQEHQEAARTPCGGT